MEAVVASKVAIEAVKFFGGRFVQQLDENQKLIEGTAEQRNKLEYDIEILSGYLKESAEKPKSFTFLERALLREVRDNVYKAEDAIDSIAVKKESNWIMPGPSTSVVDVAKRIQAVAESVGKIRKKIEDQLGIGHVTTNEGSAVYEDEPPTQEDYCPIFVKEERRLKRRLTRDRAKQTELILITGTRGIGKTIMAAKMFHNSEVKNHFTKLIWVSVPNPTAKNILLVVLKQLHPETVPKSDIPCELRKQVRSLLEKEKFLLVLDNVSRMSKEDYTELQKAFGKSVKGSKVLITSTNPELVHFVKDDSHIMLELLKLKESWDLLKWRLFPGALCPPELEYHGQLFAESCNGLPREIVSTAEALAEKLRLVNNPRERIQVFKTFPLDIAPVNESIYNELPYHLRPCFLYLGIFPGQSKFPVSKLINMWIAEGFIPQAEDVTLEETAEKYLMQLVGKNLLKIEEMRPDGSAKTCRITESTRKFCQKISAPEGENLFQDFKYTSGEGFFPQINEVNKNRRICIHADIHRFIPKFITSLRQESVQIYIRSFVSNSIEEFMLDKGDIPKFRAVFKLLKVLDAKPIKVDKIYTDLCLVHLRYVTLSISAGVLPKAISTLRKVQTLIVHTTFHTLKIEADILAMVELKYFETNASAILSKKSEASKEGERLQTLCGISPESCSGKLFSKLPNLKKLGICGELALMLFDGKNDLLKDLDKVVNLKLLNKETRGKKQKLWKTSLKPQLKLSNRILEPSKFPPSLRSLTLSATCLDWQDIFILRLMQELKELKLKDNAFLGEKWELLGDDKVFPYLQTLKIESLDFKQWECSKDHFPQLKRLTMSKCELLKKIPIELADIPTFQELHFQDGHRHAKRSAKRIRDKKLEMKNNNIVFKLLPLEDPTLQLSDYLYLDREIVLVQWYAMCSLLET
ncbi:hypothetical protein SASPL_132937 [Salvia splendens]|uniref:Disease resistance protein RPM1 n=1 Tax=Salvia splendens TaxID=180675 RepID=A0A8X8X448_SALSN|nr:hypothetical protein SASPL_132937 [Salvia splendens]